MKPIEKEQELRPHLIHIKLRFTNLYFQNYVDDKNQKKTTLVIEAPNGINRDQIKYIEKLTNTRFSMVDIRESPLQDYQPVAEAVFIRA